MSRLQKLSGMRSEVDEGENGCGDVQWLGDIERFMIGDKRLNQWRAIDISSTQPEHQVRRNSISTIDRGRFL